ncbi:MAG: glycosyl transferase, partial [Sphingobacteriales bacterium]
AYLRNLGHYTVYLPAYSDKKIIKVLSQHKGIQWHIFSKHSKKTYSQANCWIRPINNHDFISSSSSSEGVLCGAGFETPAEVLYMKKKLLVIPMKNQYEQHCNAAALKEMGVPMLKKLSVKQQDKIGAWLASEERTHVHYPDKTLQALHSVFNVVSIIKEKKRLSIIKEPLNQLILKEEFAEIV